MITTEIWEAEKECLYPSPCSGNLYLGEKFKTKPFFKEIVSGAFGTAATPAPHTS